jgi:hypothetical protein
MSITATNIYVTTNLDVDTSLVYQDTGPNFGSLRLRTTLLNKQSSDAMILSVPRRVSGILSYDVAFVLAGMYVASFGVLLRGHDFGSSIWWRWRTAQEDIQRWVTDHDEHRVTINVRGHAYTIKVQGKSQFFGYDDLYIELATGA